MKRKTRLKNEPARRAAWTWFERHGFEDHRGMVLHHKDPAMKARDPGRYAEWRHGDLVPMTA